MIVIPAIDLLGGKCVRLLQGDYDRVTVYSDNPVEMAQKWESAGAERLHVIDLDGARNGKPGNLPVIKKICKETSMNIEVGGGIREIETIKIFLDMGVHWVILGTIALENRQLAEDAIKQFGKNILIGIDARNGKVSTRGWLAQSEISAVQFAVEMSRLGIGGIIYTDIARDGMLTGPNIPALKEVAHAVQCPVIASAGISKLEDLIALRNLKIPNLLGAITGRAIYTGDLNLKEAINVLIN